MSIHGSIKKRGRPATGTGTGINVRFQPAELEAIDRWIAAQPDNPTRPEAIRRILKSAL